MVDPNRQTTDDASSVVDRDPFTEAADTTADPSLELIDIAKAPKRKIQTFEDRSTTEHHEWVRETQKTGTGATHVKTFFGKLKADSIHLMDDQINTWLDENPQHEVKFSTSAIGVMCGKTQEPALFISVWV